MNILYEKARQYAISAHARINHLRKYTLQPYDVHLKRVADLVATVTDDAEMLAAAWLHDCVEDTPATFDELEREFGNEVMSLVKELTDVSKPSDGNRAVRKAIDREHLASVSPRAKTIKLADLIDNCEDICRHDAKFGKVYLAEMQALLPLLQAGDPRLFAQATAKLASCSKRLDNSLPVPEQKSPDSRSPYLDSSAFDGNHGIRLFTEAFTAQDVLVPLPSYDRQSIAECETCRPTADASPVVGIRERGVVIGYLEPGNHEPSAARNVKPFDPPQLVTLDTPLADVIHVLTHFSHCFVTLNGAVIGVIGKQQMEKPVVRMWLFGFIILIEMFIVEKVRRTWCDESWLPLVSNGRLEKAYQLQAERQRRGLSAALLDCLQFSDKLQLAMNDAAFVEELGFPSAAAAKRTAKELESLRNNLAHGQDIVSHDWPQIVRLAQRIQETYGN